LKDIIKNKEIVKKDLEIKKFKNDESDKSNNKENQEDSNHLEEEFEEKLSYLVDKLDIIYKITNK